MNLIHRRLFLIGASAVAVASPFQGALHAQSLDAVADGKTNAWPALQRLLADGAKTGQSIVKLPPGRFLLLPPTKGEALSLPPNTRLEGAGMDRTILMMGAGIGGHVISAPDGNIQLANFTVDGNAANRPDAVGHNIRIVGDNILIDHVRSLNAASYGIGIGQKGFARNVIVRDVEIVNAGADGIDIKNDSGQTENVLIERVTIRGFGRADASFSDAEMGDEYDIRRGKAGIDLRGAHCEIRGLMIEGVGRGRDGLRFREGGKANPHGPGAHGATASNVVIKGTPGKFQGVGIHVAARGVALSDISVTDTTVGILLSADGLEVSGGTIARSRQTAIRSVRNAQLISDPPVRSLSCHKLLFQQEAAMALKNGSSALFQDCTFSQCTGPLEPALKASRDVVLNNCHFDALCAAKA